MVTGPDHVAADHNTGHTRTPAQTRSDSQVVTFDVSNTLAMLQHLQRTVGNRAVTQLLNRQALYPLTPPSHQAAAINSSSGALIQRALEGKEREAFLALLEDDKYERLGLASNDPEVNALILQKNTAADAEAALGLLVQQREDIVAQLRQFFTSSGQRVQDAAAALTEKASTLIKANTSIRRTAIAPLAAALVKLATTPQRIPGKPLRLDDANAAAAILANSSVKGFLTAAPPKAIIYVRGRAELEQKLDDVFMKHKQEYEPGVAWQPGHTHAKFEKAGTRIYAYTVHEDGTIYIDQDGPDASTLVHEMLHHFSAKGPMFSDFAGPLINEGMTAHLTLKVLQETGYSSNGAEKAYQDERLLIDMLIRLVPEPLLINAYFKDPPSLNAALAKIDPDMARRFGSFGKSPDRLHKILSKALSQPPAPAPAPSSTPAAAGAPQPQE